MEQIRSDLLNNHSVTVEKFGTLTPTMRQGHMANDLSKEEVVLLESSKTVKFYPHDSFVKILLDRKKEFVDTQNISEEQKKRNS